ncbi:unnamed protein product [Rhizopus stolonifer]
MKTKLGATKKLVTDINASPYSVRKKDQDLTIEEEKKVRLGAAYSPSYNQACLILQAIQVNGRRRLSPNCVLQLANYIARAWEVSSTQSTVDSISKTMNGLLDTGVLFPEKNLNEALIEFCKNDMNTQSVSPSITLLIAIDYIGRLKQRYNNIKGTEGCGQRLIFVAYKMASKYVHINLKSIINTTQDSLLPTHESLSPIPCSAERSTIRREPITLPSLKEQILPSPPTSPKSHSDSNPINYHYFKSTRNTPTLPSNQNISRMELEFLHFLNYDLSLKDTMKWINWAQNFDDDLDNL